MGDEFLSGGSGVFVLGGRLELPRAAQRWRGSFDWVVRPESGGKEPDSRPGDGAETHTCWTVTVGSRFNEI